MNGGIINSVARLRLVGYFYWTLYKAGLFVVASYEILEQPAVSFQKHSVLQSDNIASFRNDGDIHLQETDLQVWRPWPTGGGGGGGCCAK